MTRGDRAAETRQATGGMRALAGTEGAAAALFHHEGGHYMPSASAAGPWNPEHLHGGAVAALVADRAMDVLGDGQQLGRLTVDFLGPVPAEPLRVEAQPARAGRSFSVVEVRVTAGGADVVRGVAVGLRKAATDLPAGLPQEDPVPAREGGWPLRDNGRRPSFNRDAAELVMVDDPANPMGGSVWARLRPDVLDATANRPEISAVALADLTHGVGAVLPPDRYRAINLDLTVHMVRPPTGEWIALRARSRPGTAGCGTAEAVLLDGRGAFATAVQTMLITKE